MAAWAQRPISRLLRSAMDFQSRFPFFRYQTFTAAVRCSTGIMSSGSGLRV
jgi:hypothetical protein